LNETGVPIEPPPLLKPRDDERPENDDLPPPQPQPMHRSYFLQLGKEGYREHTFRRTVAFCEGEQCLLHLDNAFAAWLRSWMGYFRPGKANDLLDNALRPRDESFAITPSHVRRQV